MKSEKRKVYPKALCKTRNSRKKSAGVVSHRPRARPRPFQKPKADKKQNVPRVEGGTNQKQIFCIIRVGVKNGNELLSAKTSILIINNYILINSVFKAHFLIFSKTYCNRYLPVSVFQVRALSATDLLLQL